MNTPLRSALMSQRFLEDQVILETDFSICLLDLANAATAQLLVSLQIHIRIGSKDVVADVFFDRLLEQQSADPTAEHVKCSLPD